jgi:hypothetical protein
MLPGPHSLEQLLTPFCNLAAADLVRWHTQRCGSSLETNTRFQEILANSPHTCSCCCARLRIRDYQALSPHPLRLLHDIWTRRDGRRNATAVSRTVSCLRVCESRVEEHYQRHQSANVAWGSQECARRSPEDPFKA